MPNQFWQQSPPAVFQELDSSATGLSGKQAARRLLARRKKSKHQPAWLQTLRLFARQFASPLVLLLVFAALLSSFMGDWGHSAILISILLLTGTIGFWQEYRVGKAVQKLQAMMHIHCTVLRDEAPRKIQKETVVPGDVVLFSAGDVVPGDYLLLEAKDLYTNESALTGESFPAEKEPGISAADTPMSKRKNVLFEGSSVISGKKAQRGRARRRQRPDDYQRRSRRSVGRMRPRGNGRWPFGGRRRRPGDYFATI